MAASFLSGSDCGKWPKCAYKQIHRIMAYCAVSMTFWNTFDVQVITDRISAFSF